LNFDEEYKTTILFGALVKVRHENRVAACEYLLGLAMINGTDEAFRVVTKVYTLARNGGYL